MTDTGPCRSYRTAKSFDEALRELVQCAGTQFDAKVVIAFTDAARELNRK
jgi:HD-GYP domain-containing protein (c-di-GMP phosphodiesterase class II)